MKKTVCAPLDSLENMTVMQFNAALSSQKWVTFCYGEGLLLWRGLISQRITVGVCVVRDVVGLHG